jgi:predicted CopG family antitoxin
MSGGIMRHCTEYSMPGKWKKSRSDIVMRLKNKHQKQNEVLSIFWKPQTASITAAYEVVMMFVKNRKLFRDRELIKQCAVKMAQVFGEEKVAR